MPAETNLNGRLRTALGGLDPCRVENPACPGTPDISYAHGWIESKALAFPKDRDLIVRIDHYVQQQRAWHVRRRRAGGSVLVVVEDTRHGHVYVFDALWAASGLGMWTPKEMRAKSDMYMMSWDERKFRAFIDNLHYDQISGNV